jgi:hypothetical protein
VTERAIWLKREGTDTVVCIEAGEKWVEVIREPSCCPFSHIVEPSGITRRIKEAAEDSLEHQLLASGVIANAPR